MIDANFALSDVDISCFGSSHWRHIIDIYTTTQNNLIYRKKSSISRTKSQNLNVSCILLQLSSLNPLKPGVKLRMKMYLEQRR